jgi:Rieske Fe-S protein
MLDTGQTRRKFLNFCTGTLLAALGLLVAIPAAVYCGGPLRRRRGAATVPEAFVDLGALAAIPAGEWRLLSLEVLHEDGWKKTRVRHAVWVRRQGEGDQGITVLSAICPHLGCPINWHPDRAQFNCPCHGGLFNADGRHTGGPPPRAMDPLDFEVRAGHLWVRWQDFKIGVAERLPVSL